MVLNVLEVNLYPCSQVCKVCSLLFSCCCYVCWISGYCCSVAQSCLTLCNPMDCSMPGFPVLDYLPEFAQTHVTESIMPFNHLLICLPFLLPSVFPSIRVFSRKQSLHIIWPKYWSFSFSISPSNELSVLISFRMTGLISLLATGLKGLLQHHSSKASVLQRSAFFMVQLSHPYMIAGKTIALIRWTFVCKVSDVSAF